LKVLSVLFLFLLVSPILALFEFLKVNKEKKLKKKSERERKGENNLKIS